MEKRKFPREEAWSVANEIRRAFEGNCDRLVFAGSLRRQKKEVGDIEVLFTPRIAEVPDPQDMFGGTTRTDVTEAAIDQMLKQGVLAKRRNTDGHFTWGRQNKLAVHVVSGIPVDLFTASQETWWNYLACRTGGKETNQAICRTAIDRGWKWCPYDPGFVRGGDRWDTAAERHAIESEEAVFEFVRLPYLKPWERK